MMQWRFIRYLAAIAAFVALVLVVRYVLAAGVTPATGGGNISADTAATGGTGAWTTLTGPTFQESSVAELGNGQATLTAPAGFEFNTAAVVTVVLTAGNATATNNLNNAAIGANVDTATLTTTTVKFNVNKRSGGSTPNTIQYQGIQVRPTAGTPLASGNITVSGPVGLPAGNYGTLTAVAGALNKLFVVLPGQSFTSGTGVTGTATAQTTSSAFNITQLAATDKFNNTATSYTGAKTISYSGPATGCSLAPSYTTAVTFASGLSTTTLATTLRKAESTTITASDGAISGPASSSLVVNTGALNKLVITLPGQTFVPCVGNTGVPTDQSAGAAFNILSITATGANFNVITTYSGTKTLSYSGPSGSPSYTTSVNFTSGQSTTTLATILPVAETTTITTGDGTTTGPASSSLTVTAPPVSSFNAFETTTTAGATSGVIKTKIAGTAFDLDLVALTATPSVSTGFTGAVKVELLNSSGAGSCATWPVIQTLGNQTFSSGDSGRHRVSSITESNAWQNVRVRVGFPASGPTTTSCSSDTFAIRPSALAGLTISDQDWQTAGATRGLNNTAVPGGSVHKAGKPFTMTVTAQNSSGVTTSNYSGSPVAVLAQCGTSACPALANLGSLSVGTWNASAGAITTSTASYSDAGAFNLTLQDQHFADVDASDSSTAERYINSAAVNVGRFVPDHFDFTNPSTPQFRTMDASCDVRTFTYIGQPFGYVTAPQATVSARNASNGVMANFKGSLWTLTTASITQSYTPLAPASPALDISLIGTPTLSSNNDGTGTFSANSGDKLSYIRSNTTPQAPFDANITLTVSISDASENGVTGNGIISGSTTLTFNGGGSGIAFDASSNFRFGRLKLSNAAGTEMLTLPLQLSPQYWNGTGFVDLGAADSCTTIAASDIALNFPASASNQLSACDTKVHNPNGSPANLKLTKPGKNGWVHGRVNLGSAATGNTCTGDIPTAATAANKPYLRGNWGTGTYDQDPTALARFGAYTTSNAFIYLRENY